MNQTREIEVKYRVAAPSRAIRVPTLLVLGAHDNLACGPPDGIDCTEANVRAQEAFDWLRGLF